MRTKNKYFLSGFILLLLSFGLAIVSYMFYREHDKMFLIICASLTLISLICSFLNFNFYRNYDLDQQLEAEEAIPEIEIEESIEIEPDKITLNANGTNEVQPKKEILKHAQKTDSQEEGWITIDSSENQILDFISVMNDFKSLDMNPEFNCNLETLLKLNRIDQKIWKWNFEAIPFVALSHNKKTDILTIHGGMSQDNLHRLGTIPENFSKDVLKVYPHIKHIKASIQGGDYHYLSSADSSFDTLSTPYEVHVKIYS
ncbi:MAG: DUF6681 family protein [Erysipelothrix sp.]